MNKSTQSQFDSAIALTFGTMEPSDASIASVIRAARDLNFWGKRTLTAKTVVIQAIAENFKLSDDEVETILHSEGPAEKAAKAAKVAKVDNRPISIGSLSHTEETRETISGKRFLITSAQNNTPVHLQFLKNLEAYAKNIGAEIVIFPYIYNKNSFQNGNGSDDIWYAPEVKPYLQESSVWLGENNKVAAMAFNILPTVKNPLSGLKEAIGTAQAMIVPHATLAHECIAVLGAQYGEVVPAMYSTGTVTQRNYIQQQAGQKAENRHCFSALVVEFNEHGQFWVRQIETDETGTFCDLRNMVKNESVYTDQDILAVNYGDIHAEKTDVKVAEVQWGHSDNIDGVLVHYSMLNYFKPKYQFIHDLLDFSSLNHHNRDNHYHMAKNQVNGETVKGDLQQVASILQDMARPWCETVVVRSNHDDALDRWLSDNKYEARKDPANALTYFKLQVAAYSCIADNTEFVSLPYALEQIAEMVPPEYNGNKKISFLRASESFKLKGVEYGEHGHSGTNGSRGSPKQFNGMKCNTGHTHSSSIYGGCYTAGVSGSLAMGYNETGASSWVHASILTYSTGYRTIVHLKDNGAGELAYMA